MKEEEPNWFSRWEEELPSPEELMPLSQSLITPDLALAFDISRPNSNSNHHQHQHIHVPTLAQSPSQSQQQQQNPSPQQMADYDSSEIGGNSGGGVAGGDEQARTLKRPRLVWTPQLHKRFVDAVAHLGIKNAVPKTIMQLMSVDGLTRENVASHLQKYRLYLKRMQGISSGNAHPGAVSHSDAATEQLFASSPIPHHFLSQRPVVGTGVGGAEQFLPFVPVAALQHHQQMAAAAAHQHQQQQQQQQQQQFYHHRHMGHLGSPPGVGFDHGFLSRQQQQQNGMHRIVGPAGVRMVAPMSGSGLVEDSDSGGGGRKVLTLFPTNDD